MKIIILNIEDSIFDEIINSLKSYPKSQNVVGCKKWAIPKLLKNLLVIDSS